MVIVRLSRARFVTFFSGIYAEFGELLVKLSGGTRLIKYAWRNKRALAIFITHAGGVERDGSFSSKLEAEMIRFLVLLLIRQQRRKRAVLKHRLRCPRRSVSRVTRTRKICETLGNYVEISLYPRKLVIRPMFRRLIFRKSPRFMVNLSLLA